MHDVDLLEQAVHGIMASAKPLAARLHGTAIVPMELFALACGTAEAVMGQYDAPSEAASFGAIAFVTGFVAGTRQHPAPAGEPRRSLAQAVELIHRHGRHTIIAQRCDLSHTASKQTLSARLLGTMAEPLAEPQRAKVEGCCARLYESGLATGLLTSGST